MNSLEFKVYLAHANWFQGEIIIMGIAQVNKLKLELQRIQRPLESGLTHEHLK